jgi:hypothetical protein
MKLKNSHLLIIFIALAVVIFFYYKKKNSDTGTLKNSFFEIEESRLSDAINKITVRKNFSEELEYCLVKKDSLWFIENEDGSLAETDPELIPVAMREINKIKPSRLVSESKDSWAEYGVDSSGTLINFQTNETEFQIILGQEGFQDQVRVNTYCRVPSEDETYAVEAYFLNSLKETKKAWRNKFLLDMEKAYWAKLTLKFNDTIISAEISDKKWFLDNSEMDSSQVIELLGSVEKFMKLPLTETAKLQQPTITLTIENFDNSVNNQLSFYPTGQLYIITSTANQGNHFVAKKEDVNALIEVFKNIKGNNETKYAPL